MELAAAAQGSIPHMMLEAPSASQEPAEVFLNSKAIYSCFALSPYKTPKPRAEISFSSRELLLGLCLPLPSLCAVFAAVNPKPGCSFTNSSCHSPLTQSWNRLSGTPKGLFLPKCFLPSLVSAIDFISLIWVCFEHVSVPHHLQLTVQGV